MAGQDVYAAVEGEQLREDSLHQGCVVSAGEVAAADAAGKQRVAAEENLPAVLDFGVPEAFGNMGRGRGYILFLGHIFFHGRRFPELTA